AEAFPRQPPSPRQLFLDALASRMRGLLSGWRLPVLLYHASIELISGGRRTRKSSLNRPTGARRALALATADLARTRDAAHAAGGTVNDVLLTAIAGALDAVLKDRGELVDRMTLSVMVSGRRTTTTPALGNSVGVMLATLPAPETHTETHTETRPETDVLSRIRHTADITRSRKARVRGASSVVITPLFRALSACHLATWFYNHQRRITTFVSNLRGPTSWLAICGCRIERIIPISATSGNVTVAFAVLSYAGTLAITTVADPDTCPDVERLAGYLQAELDLLTLGASPAPDAHQGHQQSSTISWRSPRSS
ncbi:MAG: DUF1298 domain-containing protein, partial [Micromonosporaceae bacterium]|nr:DUF1298 domain-containing protein [Micromonosporaceae bacterium]